MSNQSVEVRERRRRDIEVLFADVVNGFIINLEDMLVIAYQVRRNKDMP